MTPTEAALRAALEEAVRWADESENDPCEICGVKRERCGCWLGMARKALAAPPHGKDAGEEPCECTELTCCESCRRKAVQELIDNPLPITRLRREAVAQRDALQDLIHTANDTLDIVAASPQDFVTHVLLLREERDELKARLTEAEGLLREYLRPGRNSPEDLDGENRAFLKEATP